MNTLVSENVDLRLAINLTTLLDEWINQMAQFVEQLKSQTITDWKSKCQCGVICDNFDEIIELSEWQKSKSDFNDRFASLKTQLHERITILNCDKLNTESSSYTFAGESMSENSDLINVGKFLKTTFSVSQNEFVVEEKDKPRQKRPYRKRAKINKSNEECDFCLHRYVKIAIPNAQKLRVQDCICEPDVQCERYGCNYIAKCQHDLDLHLFCKHEEGTVCDFAGCNYTSKSRYRLTVHKRTHTVFQNMFDNDINEEESNEAVFVPEVSLKVEDDNDESSNEMDEDIEIMGEPDGAENDDLEDIDPDDAEAVKRRYLELRRLEHACEKMLGDTRERRDSFTVKFKQDVLASLKNVFKGNKSACANHWNIKRQTLQKWVKSESALLNTTGEKPYKCEQCDYSASSIQCLSQHKLLHNTQILRCDFENCTYETPNPNHFERHKKMIHGGYKKFNCPWENCQYRAATQNLVDQHYRLHTGEKPIVCPYPDCDQRFPMKSYLCDHVRIHHKNIPRKNPYVCSWPGCSVAFSSRKMLGDHINMHSGNKPYKCDWPGCDGAFAREDRLKIHKRSHTGERPYICSWPSCDKKFSTKHRLDLHMRIHTGYKPHQCPHPGCQYRASLSGNVNKHFNKRHKKHL